MCEVCNADELPANPPSCLPEPAARGQNAQSRGRLCQRAFHSPTKAAGRSWLPVGRPWSSAPECFAKTPGSLQSFSPDLCVSPWVIPHSCCLLSRTQYFPKTPESLGKVDQICVAERHRWQLLIHLLD